MVDHRLQLHTEQCDDKEIPVLKISVQEMQKHLASMGVETSVDFESNRLYIVSVVVPQSYRDRSQGKLAHG